MCGFIFLAPMSWALSEDDYASMAARNLKMMHEVNGNVPAMARASEEFMKSYSKETIFEYLEMARRIMQDPGLASRISQKIIRLLKDMGYRVHASPGSGMDSIMIEN